MYNLIITWILTAVIGEVIGSGLQISASGLSIVLFSRVRRLLLLWVETLISFHRSHIECHDLYQLGWHIAFKIQGLRHRCKQHSIRHGCCSVRRWIVPSVSASLWSEDDQKTKESHRCHHRIESVLCSLRLTDLWSLYLLLAKVNFNILSATCRTSLTRWPESYQSEEVDTGYSQGVKVYYYVVAGLFMVLVFLLSKNCDLKC